MPHRRGVLPTALPITDAGALDRADTYARGIPHDRLERLRAKTPVVWLDGRAAGRPGSWAVLRHADVRRALLHPELFAPQGDGVVHGPATDFGFGTGPDTGGHSPDGGPGDAHDAALIDMDPPARALLARVPSKEPVDFVGEVVGDLPETLRNTLAGGLYALLRHPAQFARLREERYDEGLVDSAVEEMLRWWTPVLQVWRVVQRGTVIGGVPLLAGERVTLWLVSANHDDEVFAEPRRFLPERFLRDVRSHLCFGFGQRACLGARLARVHLRALLDAVLERPGLPQLAGEPVPLRSSARHGFEHLPIRWTA
ncbi:cytochrome P450 [Actinomadura decatromicini]|uniref:Cytochrome P450 n=1 Tax=Actinomadura decatromicini TaxID=2604572 RepID=A0A5D3FYQ6_9ACTN|nr:cytochrome P450 [Actinomadura decatromicini]TYK53314.1 cytochrome P450 [Actinomadura decatromicini]